MSGFSFEANAVDTSGDAEVRKVPVNRARQETDRIFMRGDIMNERCKARSDKRWEDQRFCERCVRQFQTWKTCAGPKGDG